MNRVAISNLTSGGLTIAAILIILGVILGPAYGRSIFDDIRNTAPRSIFDDIQDSAPLRPGRDDRHDRIAVNATPSSDTFDSE